MACDGTKRRAHGTAAFISHRSSVFICVHLWFPRFEENEVLRVEGLYTEYPNERGEIVKAAQDVNFDVPEGKLFTLLGPSGCGKTTTLRSIAGLERPRAGEISVGGRVMFSADAGIFVAPNQRNFGM